jgi:hypothetical protein
MKITALQIQKAIDAKLPAYFATADASLHDITNSSPEGYTGTWFKMAFTYPGVPKLKYCWMSIPNDRLEMTDEQLDIWSTDAAVQIKLTQTIDELEAEAKRLKATAMAKRYPQLSKNT